MANTKQFTMGLAKILFGKPETDGGMSKNLQAVGYTLQDSCSISTDDPDVTEFYAEEVDAPVVTKSKKGKVNLALSVMNPSLDTFKMFLGGNINTEKGRWEDGDVYEDIELSVRIIPDQGFGCIDMPRVKIDAKINAALNNSSLLTLDVAGICLQPNKEGEPKIAYYDNVPSETNL